MSIHGNCFDIGMAGNCGLDCPIFREGNCENVGEFVDEVKELDLIEFMEFCDLYEEFLGQRILPPIRKKLKLYESCKC